MSKYRQLARALEVLHNDAPKYPSMGIHGSLPGETLTIVHKRYTRLPSITSDKRQMYGAQHVYHSGISKPNYPVPAVRNNPGQKPWHNKLHALNHGMWRWYWYLSGL